MATPPSHKGWGYWFLIAFLLVAWVCSTSQALPHFLPASIARIVSLGCLALYPVLLGLAVFHLRVHTGWLSGTWFDYILLLTVSMLVLATYGLVRGNAPRIIVFDLLAYAPVTGGLLLGRLDRVWRWLMPPVFALTILSVMLALRFTDSQVLSDRSILNNQVGAFFEANLTLAPLLAIIAATESRNRWYYPLLLASFGAFFVYLYFGRRGISVRAGAEILCAAAIMPLILGFSDRALRNTLVVFLFGLALFAYFPFDVLTARFLGRYGLLDTLTSDNARWLEASLLWSELNWWETLVGRGFGGVFLVDRIDNFSFDELTAGSFGKMGTHLGLALPILKGGFIFALLYFLPAFKLIGSLGQVRRLDPITLGCAVATVVWMAAQMIEGALSYSTPWVGFGVGLLFSRTERIWGIAAQPVRPTQSGPRKTQRKGFIAPTCR